MSSRAGSGRAWRVLSAISYRLSAARTGVMSRRAELAGGDRFERGALAVDRDHRHVGAGLAAGRLERLDGAERHLVVVRVDGGDLGPERLRDVLHHALALGA